MGVEVGVVGVGWEEAGQARWGEEGPSWPRRQCLAWEMLGR